MEEGGGRSNLEKLGSNATPARDSSVSEDSVIKKNTTDIPIVQAPATYRSDDVNTLDSTDDTNESTCTVLEERQSLQSSDSTMYTAESQHISDGGDVYEGSEGTLTANFESASGEGDDAGEDEGEGEGTIILDDGDRQDDVSGENGIPSATEEERAVPDTVAKNIEGIRGEDIVTKSKEQDVATSTNLDRQIMEHVEKQAAKQDKHGEEETLRSAEEGQLEQKATKPVEVAQSQQEEAQQSHVSGRENPSLKGNSTTKDPKILISPPEVLGQIERDAPLESGSDTEVEELGSMDGPDGISGKEIKDESFTTTKRGDSVANGSSDTPAEEAKDSNRDAVINNKNTSCSTSHEANGSNGKTETKHPSGDSVLRWIHASGPMEGQEKGEKRSKEFVKGQLQSHRSDLANEKKKKTVVFEDVKGEHNGSKLTSIKPNEDFKKQLEVSRRELVSGRRAGQRWEQSRIRFAPLNVPLRRRLQTFMVLFHTLCMAMCISAFFFLLSIPLFWPILVPYMVYCMVSNASTSGTLKHRSRFLRSLPVWSLFASYFPVRLHRSIELPPTRKYIFGYHPHGIISHGAWSAFATEALGFSQLFPGITNTLLTLDSNFRMPIYRDYILGMGLASVSRESCENLLSRGGPNKEGMGRAITIVIGGARESLDAQPYSMKLVLKCRKGFVKMGIRCGADLVPVLAFGENDLYDQYQADEHPYIHKFQMMVKKFLGFTVPLFHARGVFNYDVGLMPYRRPINIVVGRPVKVVQSSKPSLEEVDKVHAEYIAELQRLWDLWKDDFAPHRKGELQIIE